MEHKYKLVVEKTTEYHFDISSNDVDDIQTKEEIIQLIISKKYELPKKVHTEKLRVISCDDSQELSI
jgi:hypothetical protein|tara:strand:+ start:459 stop:659 length:201 start_codon:yes stop_codon:yes gene_type:complete